MKKYKNSIFKTNTTLINVAKNVVLFSALMCGKANAQIPVEVFAGHKKTSLDLMFFKYFKNKADVNSKFCSSIAIV